MKKLLKQMLAMVLSLALVSSGISALPMSTSKAATTGQEEMSVNSVLNFTAGADWRFNFNMNGTWPTTGELDKYTNTNVTVTIKNASGETLATVEGDTLENCKNGSYWLLVIWGAYTGSNAPAVGDTITISSGQLAYASDANKIVNFAEETVLKYDGANWSVYVEQTIEEMSVDSVLNFEASNHWRFNLNMKGTWPTTGELDKYTNTSVTATIKNASGETLATVEGSNLETYKNGPYWLLAIWGAHTGSNAPVVGDTITISSGQLASASDVNTIVNFAEETVLKYDGANWSAYVEQTIEEMSVDSVLNFEASNHWRFNLNMKGTWPTTGELDKYTNTSVTATIKNASGETLATVEGSNLETYKNGPYWLLAIWGAHTGSNAPVAGDTITISSGQLAYESDANTIVNFAEETVLKYDGANWSVYEEQTIEEMSVDSVLNFTWDGNWRFNFNMNGTWPTTGELDKYTNTNVTVTIKNASGETLATVEGDTLENCKNGSYWLLVIWGAYTGSNAPVAGDTITISSGQLAYESDANTIVNFAGETVLKYDGEAWETIGTNFGDTGVLHDVNADGELNAKDLVRMKRYLADVTTAINAAQKDINFSGVTDDADAISLRKVLVGLIRYGAEGLVHGVPVYNNGLAIERMAYACPAVGTLNSDGSFASQLSDAEINAVFQEYKAAGFTLLNSEHVASYKDQAFASEYNKPLRVYLEAAERNGLGVIVSSDYLNAALRSDDLSNGNHHNWQAVVDHMIDNMSGYESFRGFMMSDELTITYASNYQTIAGYLNENYPELLLHSSQLPVTAYSSLGASALTLDTTTNRTEELAYRDYIWNFAQASGTYTYDLYPLVYSADKVFGTTVKSEHGVNDDWYRNLKYVADEVKEHNYNFTTGITLQSCKLEGTNTIWSQYERYAPTGKADIGFQIYTAMAYGMQEFNFFTYEDHFTDTTVSNAIADNEEVYASVQAVNTEVDKFAHVFKAFSWKDTLDIADGSSASTTLSSRLALASVAGARAFVGCMKDDDGFDGYMVANADGPRTAGTATVTLTFNNATKAIVYTNGVPKTVTLSNGVCTISVDAGEGVFVIPYCE